MIHYNFILNNILDFPGSSASKESACNAGDPGSIARLPTPVFLGFAGGLDGKESGLQCGSPAFDSWVGKIPWRRALQCSCLENPHGQRNLVGYSPWGHKKSDTAEQLSIAQTASYPFYPV